jgi:protein SCO1/2
MKSLHLLLAFAFISGLAVAQEPEPAPKAANPAPSYFRDLALVDQNGTEVDLYALMKGRTIVINTFFASCSGSCPVMAAAFSAIQTHYGERVGRDLVLVSITVDPEHDTPAKLREYAKRVNAGAGWYFLSGTREQVDRALRKLGQYVEVREQHQNIFLIGNDRTGLWKKALGLAKPAELIEVVRSVVDDPGVAGAGGTN